MTCSSCGCDLASGAQFCVRCGKRTAGAEPQAWAPVAGTVPRSGFAPTPLRDQQQARVEQNVQALGLAWCVYGAYRIVTMAAVATAARTFGWSAHFGHAFWPLIGFSTLFFSGLSVLAGIGLLTRRPWARGLAIVLGVLALLRLPVGTALGVYTLWVLGSKPAREQWRRTQVA